MKDSELLPDTLSRGNRRCFVRLGICVAVLVLLVLTVFLWPRESLEEVQVVNRWMALTPGRSPKEWQQLTEDLQRFGPRVVPMILRRVRQHIPWRTRVYRQLWEHIPSRLQARLPKPKPIDDEYHVKDRARSAISKFGPEVLPHLLKAARDWNSAVREVVVGRLGDFAGTHEIALDQLIKSLGDSKAFVRINAVSGLSQVTNRAAKVVPGLIQRLNDSDAGPKPGQIVFVRANAALALGQIGAAASNAVPMLRKLKEQPPSDRATMYASVHSAVALWRIERKAEEVIPFMARTLRT